MIVQNGILRAVLVKRLCHVQSFVSVYYLLYNHCGQCGANTTIISFVSRTRSFFFNMVLKMVLKKLFS